MAKRKELEAWQVEDAARLKELFDERWQGASQEKFANDFGIGTQGAVWQYLAGKIPLNMDALLKFCRGLKARAEEISPTLAKRLHEYQRDTTGAGPTEASTLSGPAIDVALAWMRLTPARQHAIREWVFLESVLAEHYPWLLPGRPSGQSYNDYEKSVEDDLIRITKVLMMKGEDKS